MGNAKGHIKIKGNIINKIYVKTPHFTVFKDDKQSRGCSSLGVFS